MKSTYKSVESQSRSDDMLLTAGFNLRIADAIPNFQSRSDDTLLTAGFNLRIKRTDSPL